MIVAMNSAASPATHDQPAIAIDLQPTPITLGLAPSRARPATLSGDAALAGFAVS
jgi:hypothetical protein